MAAEIQRRRGNHGAARQAFERAASLDKKNLGALAGLVSVALAEKRPAEAVRLIEARLAQDPNDATLLTMAGDTYAATGDLAKAEAALQRAIQLSPGSMDAYHKLARVYTQQNRLADARRTYDERAKQRPDDVTSQTIAGMITLVQGDLPDARRRFEAVLNVDPNAAIAANNLAYLDAEAGVNLDVALTRAQIAKAALPDHPDVNDTLGWVYYKRDLPSLAVPPLEQSVQRAPNNPVSRYHLGMVYLKLGQKDKAREALEQALKLNLQGPDAAEARKALAELGR